MGDNLFTETSAGLVRLAGVLTQKDHPDGILRRQFGVEMLQSLGTQKCVGLLHQQTATVTGFAVSIDATAVSHAGQGLNGSL